MPNQLVTRQFREILIRHDQIKVLGECLHQSFSAIANQHDFYAIKAVQEICKQFTSNLIVLGNKDAPTRFLIVGRQTHIH